MIPPTFEEYKKYLAKQAAATPNWKVHAKEILPNALAFAGGSAAAGATGLLASKIYSHFNPDQKIPLSYLAVAAPVLGAMYAAAHYKAHKSQHENIQALLDRAPSTPD